jgi:YVTN family beta-propeller protein
LTFGTQSISAAVAPDGKRVYFTDPAEVGVVDTSTNDVVGALPVPCSWAIVVSPDGRTAYIRNGGVAGQFDELSVVDLPTGTVTATLTPSAWTSGCGAGANHETWLILSSDGSTLYTIEFPLSVGLPGSVLSIDTSTLSITPIADPGSLIGIPVGLTLANSKLYIANELDNPSGGSVVVVDTATKTVTGNIPLPGTVTGAIGSSLDESEVFVSYQEPTHVTFAIIDPTTDTRTGTVADPNGYIIDAFTAVDPFLPPHGTLTCFAGKRQASGKEILGKLGCFAKAAVTGGMTDPTCVSRVEGKLDKSFARFGTACPGDEPTVRGLIDTCVATLLSDLPGAGTCAAKSAKALGKSANNLTGCAVTELKKPGSFGDCESRQLGKLAKSLIIAGSCAGPSAASDVQACVDEIVAALPLSTP